MLNLDQELKEELLVEKSVKEDRVKMIEARLKEIVIPEEQDTAAIEKEIEDLRGIETKVLNDKIDVVNKNFDIFSESFEAVFKKDPSKITVMRSTIEALSYEYKRDNSEVIELKVEQIRGEFQEHEESRNRAIEEKEELEASYKSLRKEILTIDHQIAQLK